MSQLKRFAEGLLIADKYDKEGKCQLDHFTDYVEGIANAIYIDGVDHRLFSPEDHITMIDLGWRLFHAAATSVYYFVG